jgi:MFS family permease
LLAKAAAGPVWTKSSDIWGRKPALLNSVILFAVASTIAALSTSMRMLIAARALQGVAAGGLFQLVQVTVSDLFSVRKRALYFSWMGAIWAIAGTVGPLLGGMFAEKLTWRWCFWINLPICGFSFALLFLLLDVHNPRTGVRDGLQAIDWFGTASMLAVTVLVLLGLNFGGGVFPWNSAEVICLIVIGTCMVAAFVFSEKRLAKYPLMPLSVFSTVSNCATFAVSFGHNMVSIGAEFYLPLFFQSVRQASPLRSGLLLLPLTVSAASTDVIVGLVINRTGRYREMIWTGTIMTTLGAGLYINLWTETPLAEIVVFEIIAIHSTVKQADVASATASLGFLNNLATSLSVVVGGVVFQNSMSARHPGLAAAGLDEHVLDALAGDKAAANVNIVKTIADSSQRRAVQDAFAGSVRNIFIVYTSIAAVIVVASMFIEQKQMSTEHTETKTGIANLRKREAVET